MEIPRNLKHALELDKLNGNNLWGEATEKEVNEILEHATFTSSFHYNLYMTMNLMGEEKEDL